jgi:addiction module HigA family antidote
MTKTLAPIHSGEVLLEEFLRPMEISQYRLAKDIGVPPRRINEIVHGIRGVTADTACGSLGTLERRSASG